MVDLHHANTVAVPLRHAFSWVDDHRNAPRFMFGLAEFEPAKGRPAQGLGAAFDALFRTGPVRIRTTLEVVEWVENEIIRFDSTAGFRNWSAWSFAAEGPDRTAIAVDFSYELPGGLAGRLLGKAIEPIVSPAITYSDSRLRGLLEAEHADGCSG